jgi:hypothetical protein
LAEERGGFVAALPRRTFSWNTTTRWAITNVSWTVAFHVTCRQDVITSIVV